MNDQHAMHGINDYWRQLSDDELAAGEHRGMIGGLWEEIGRLQLERLIEHGLEPHHRLIDVGCGALRGGVHFVRHLDPGNYCGLDVNASLIEAGRRELEAAGLGDRGARLLVDDGFRVERFGERFHFALAQSLFTHLPMNHVIWCLAKVAAVLEPTGALFATFFRAPRPAHLEPIIHQPGATQTHYHRDIFHYAAEEMVWMGRLAGLEARVVGDWGHPRAQQLVIYRPASGSGPGSA